MRMLQDLVLICLLAGACSQAQDKEAGKATAAPKLEFSNPRAVEDLDVAPMIVGRLDCGDDGSIYTLIDGYALNSERLALLSVHPDGTVTSFPWRSAPGFADISMPKSIFVGNGRVYVLVNAESNSAKQAHRSRYSLVLAFDKDGSLVGTVVLEHDLNPLVLGVFPSGNILLVSEDRLNHRMALNLVGADGTPIRELPLYASDFLIRAAQMPAAARGTSSYSPTLLISMSKFFPSGDHLLLVPLDTSGLPIVELDERGILHSVIPHLPDNMVLEAFLPSNDALSWKVRLSTVLEDDKEMLDSQGKVLGVATRPSARIAELSRTGGGLLQEIDMGGDGIQPACETDDTFRFLTLGAGQGHLQVVTAQVR
jgi:hypothetical protein